MDVRCEKCLTVYDFDDAKVGTAGVTVKCTECGNLFKVRRRVDTQELPSGAAIVRAAEGVALSQAVSPPPLARGPASPVHPRPEPAIQPRVGASSASPEPAKPAASTPDEERWMVRLAASGEVLRFRELTTLQQWIVERRVTREDEISRSGESWKCLGGITELSAFFVVVDQAGRAGPPPPQDESGSYPRPALPVFVQDQPSGPIAMGTLPVEGGKGLGAVVGADPAFAGGGSSPELAISDAAGDEPEMPRRRRGGLYLGLLSLLVVCVAGAYLGLYRRDALKGLLGQEDGRGKEAFQQGREYFLLDSDEAFRQAVVAFERAHGADESNALPLAGLAEVNLTWAWYLREDARALESAGPAAHAEGLGRALRTEAQVHLDNAKRYADEAVALAPNVPAVNRAMADYLRVDGAAAPQVERYLRHATELAPDDAELVYVQGALAAREGRVGDAQRLLERANQLNKQATQHDLLRAHFLLAKLALQAGDKDGARSHAEVIVAANAQHERAKAILAHATALGAAGAGTAAAAGTAAGATAAGTGTGTGAGTGAAAGTAAGAGAAAGAAAGAGTAVGPGRTAAAAGTASLAAEPEDYRSLVAQGDRVSENGHAEKARKLYEKALALNPRGPEAITGLGFCDLDGEKFMAAIERFKRALDLSPDYGEALIGLAEAYKVRSDRPHALEYYKRYLKALPGGPKAAMAQKNVRDLEPAVPSSASAPAAVHGAGEPAAEPEKPSAGGGETPLPRPPPAPDEPPP
jgi:predicted Zn finger-like uncharacterized protein